MTDEEWTQKQKESGSLPVSPDGKLVSCGRKVALQVLDSLFNDHHNVHKLYDSLQDRFDQNPAMFFQDFIMPTMPKLMLEQGIQENESVEEKIRKACDQMNAAMNTLQEAKSETETDTNTIDGQATEEATD